jgi:hypothetical protein
VDQRLSLDPFLRPQRQRDESQRAAVRAACGPERWATFVAPIADRIATQLETGPFLNPDGDSILEIDATLASEILAASASKEANRRDLRWVLEEALGAELANRFATEPTRWLPLICSDLPSNTLTTFCNSLPPESVRTSAPTICSWAGQLNVEDMLEARDVELGEGKGLELWLREQRAVKDDWEFATRLDQVTGRAMPKGFLLWGAELALRGGPDICLDWFRQLADPFTVSVAVNWLRKPIALIEMLELIATQGSASVLAVQIAREAINLWETLDRNLAQAADGRWQSVRDDGALSDDQAQLASWREEELPAVGTRWATALASPTLSGVGIGFLRNTFITRWNSAEPPAVRPLLRRELIRAMSTHVGVVPLVTDLLGQPLTPGGVLCAAMATLQENPATAAPDPSLVFNAYVYWEIEYLSHYPTNHDDGAELAWALAGVLSRFADPMPCWQQAFAGLGPGEGWLYTFEQARRLDEKKAHLLIVGGMATEWLQQGGRAADARKLFLTVWSTSIAWARTLGDGLSAQGALPALVQVWARLALVMNDAAQPMAVAAIPKLDRVDWLVSCVATLEGNVARNGVAGLSQEVRNALREWFDVLRVTWELSSGVAPDDREATVARVADLCGAAV